MSFALMYGTNGCKKDLNEAKNYLLQVNDNVKTYAKWDEKDNLLHLNYLG